jgi:ribosome maturation factor RimP
MDLQTLIEPTLVGMGYELVALERVGRGLLRVYIDSPNGIGVDDCVKVSNQLTRLFMVEDVDYSRLEVSSPGLDRPLVKEADFIRFAGEKAQIKLRMPMEGRKKFVGRLAGLQDGVLNLETDSGAVAIPLVEVESARLVPKI